ncbi:MAG: hypothetical protein KF841_04375 [Phycisphaerae bacterium]|nr:hypothetical protein [Phycisphaerae bacterium]
MRISRSNRVLPFMISCGLLIIALTAAVGHTRAAFDHHSPDEPVLPTRICAADEITSPNPADQEKNPDATIDDLAWMSGGWHGEIFGGPIQEHWHAPKDGVILGTSRMGADRARSVYEFMLIEEKNGVPTMFLRHFRQYLSSDEKAPMEYALTQIENKKATFETSDKSLTFTRITYQAEGRKTLVVTLESERNDKPMRVVCRMSRKTGK